MMKSERGHPVRLSAKRELAPLDYERLSALRALAGRMPALRYPLTLLWTLSFNSITISPPY
jgi:hypothetical protein